MKSCTVFLAIVLMVACGWWPRCPLLAADAGDSGKAAVGAVLKNPEGRVSTAEIDISQQDFKDGTIVKSVRLGDLLKPSGEAGKQTASESNPRELFWFKGIKVDTAGGGSEKVAGQLSLVVDPGFRNQIFPESESCHQPVLLQLDPVSSVFLFPDGSAVPAASDETWTFHFKPINPVRVDVAPTLRRCTLYFVRDSELVYPMDALSWNVTFAGSPTDVGKLVDAKFVRPQWRYECAQTSAPFCGIPVKHASSKEKADSQASPAGSLESTQTRPIKVSSAPNRGSSIPVFDSIKDGPLLTEPKRVELDTTAGKLHLLLDPGLAPNHATQLYRLLKGGAFTGTPISRYEADFVMQISLAEHKVDGQPPLSGKHRALLRRMSLEVAPQADGSVIHQKWVLSMARDDDDTASGTSSFSMILGNAPHLDKKYTIFGRVIDDPVTLATFEKIVKEWPNHPWILNVRDIPSP